MNEIKVTVGRHRMLMIRIVSGALAIVCAVYTLGIFKSIWNNTYWQLMYSGTLIFSLMMPLLFLSGTLALSAVAYVAKPYEILINS